MSEHPACLIAHRDYRRASQTAFAGMGSSIKSFPDA